MGSSQSTEEHQADKTNVRTSHQSKYVSPYKQYKDERDEVDKKISEIDYTEYEYPFENFVFEGGGAKGQVYIGCLKVHSFVVI